MKKHHKISSVSKLHIAKLIYRSVLFFAVLVCYILTLTTPINLNHPAIIAVFIITWIVYVVEMILRFFPSRLESPGCQKQFKRNFKPTEVKKPTKSTWRSTLVVALVWIALNGAIAILHFTLSDIVTNEVLFLISLAYGICDLICIMFFCPFQSWFMKNRCCATCRIYNWDFAMMFTPFIFLIPANPYFAIYTYSLLGLAIALLLRWEITHLVHPERFSEETNCYLKCENCSEKLCHHKTQLRHIWKKWKKKAAEKISKTLNK